MRRKVSSVGGKGAIVNKIVMYREKYISDLISLLWSLCFFKHLFRIYTRSCLTTQPHSCMSALFCTQMHKEQNYHHLPRIFKPQTFVLMSKSYIERMIKSWRIRAAYVLLLLRPDSSLILVGITDISSDTANTDICHFVLLYRPAVAGVIIAPTRAFCHGLPICCKYIQERALLWSRTLGFDCFGWSTSK